MQSVTAAEILIPFVNQTWRSSRGGLYVWLACRAWQEAGNAPPLTRSRDLYYLLYHKGFSVTFITGR